MSARARILASGKLAMLLYGLVKDRTPEEKVEFGNDVRRIYGINTKIGFAFYEEDGNELVDLITWVDMIADGQYLESEEPIVLEIVR